MNKYFVVSDRSDELEVIKHLKPDRILISYMQFKRKSVIRFMNSLGYRPYVMIDPGAYTAYKKHQEIELNDYIRFAFNSVPSPLNNEWMDYIKSRTMHKNRESCASPFPEMCIPSPMDVPFASKILSLDIINNPEQTMKNYKIMRDYFDNLIPVFHYGADIAFLEQYISMGAKYIALGGICVEKDKQKIAAWVHDIVYRYQLQAKFHLLGTTSNSIIKPNMLLESCDSSSWIQKAAFGYPKTIPGTQRSDKISRAESNMTTEQLVYGYY